LNTGRGGSTIYGVATLTHAIEAGQPLLERDEVLGALDEALADAKAGHGRFVLLAGEAGGGKTLVVRRFVAEARGASRVLWGACDPLFTPRPLGPLLDIAGEAGGELRAAVESGRGPHEIVSLLLREASHSPVVVVVEDVHWADEATYDVLRLLARKVEFARALVIATFRDDVVDRAHPLQIVLGELVTAGAVRRVSVEPLSEEAVAELAGPALVDPAVLYRQTSGNPFFVTEVLAAGDEAIPRTIRDAVLARAARLDSSAREVLDAVAIAPSGIEPWLLDALAGDGVDALGECLSSGMLVARPAGVEFRHELARLAWEGSLDPVRRVALHRTALAALTARGNAEPDAARLAHHAEAAGDADAVLRHAIRAAERAASLRAHREAADQYARALRHADLLSPDARAELLERAANACYLTDRCGDAISAVEEALDCYRRLGDRVKEGEALCLLSRLQMCPASVFEATPAGEQAITILEEFPPGSALAMAYANLAAIRMNAEDAQGTHEWGTRAIALAEELGDNDCLAHALNSLGTMEFLLHGPEGRELVERSVEVAFDAGVEAHVLRGYSNMTWAAARHRSHDLAERYLQAGLARCREPDFDLWRLHLLGYRARLRLEQGLWDDAVESAMLAVRDPRSSPLPRILAMTVLGLVRARRGDPEVWPLLDEAERLAAPSGELQRIVPVAAARAEAAWLAGNPAAVATATDAALALAVERDASWLVGELALWRRRAGIREPAPGRVPEPYALELAGSAEKAAESWRSLGCPYEAALALGAATGEATLRRALHELQALDARPAATIVARRLRERGARGLPRGPRRSTRASPRGLTARELEVLRLLATGLRNGEIASRLFVSARTVDNHVSAILRKLEARTRGEAVAAAGALGLLEDA